jgi:cell division protein FtsB
MSRNKTTFNSIKRIFLKRKYLGFVILIAVLYLGFIGDYNLYKLWKLEREKETLLQEIDINNAKSIELQAEIDRLQTDSSYIEKKAREDFNMGKKGETVFMLKETEKQ